MLLLRTQMLKRSSGWEMETRERCCETKEETKLLGVSNLRTKLYQVRYHLLLKILYFYLACPLGKQHTPPTSQQSSIFPKGQERIGQGY